jgi:hypothetical protein
MPILAKQGRLEGAPEWSGTPVNQLVFESSKGGKKEGQG